MIMMLGSSAWARSSGARRAAGELAACQAADGDGPIVDVVETSRPTRALAVKHQEAIAVEAEAVGAHAVQAYLAVEVAWRVARLADVAAGADDQLRRPGPLEIEAGEMVDVAGDHHGHAREVASARGGLLGGVDRNLDDRRSELADRQPPDRPMGH